LTATQADFVLGLLDREPGAVSPVEHQRGRAAARLTWRLAQFAEESGAGEVYSGETRFLSKGPRTTESPDLAFVSREHLAAGQAGAGFWAGAPDLVVQFAPSRTKGAAAWLDSGTRAVLVLDPAARTIEVHEAGSPRRVLGAEGVLALPDLLPGWSLRVGDLFQ
jgi:Uma2 family endonuclease